MFNTNSTHLLNESAVSTQIWHEPIKLQPMSSSWVVSNFATPKFAFGFHSFNQKDLFFWFARLDNAALGDQK